MKPTLLILAAGMASRYGSLKQIAKFGPSGESIIDYSIYDAIRAGFEKVVFIIRKNFAEEFKEIFEPKLKGKIQTDYIYQELTSYLGDYTLPAEREKPWGTAHAVLCAKESIQAPFAVINADDYYGKDSFKLAFKFLTDECIPSYYALIGYELAKTLSEYGTVSRGVCSVSNNNELLSISERTKVYEQNHEIVYEENGSIHRIPGNSFASMNFWCFHPSYFAEAFKYFQSFLKSNLNQPKSEFFIPDVADSFIKNKKGRIAVLPTADSWFGVTYKEDAPIAKEKISSLISRGIYPNKLW